MSNVIAFTPRPRAPQALAMPPLAGIDLRAHLEEAAQTALDAADKIIAALDRIEDAGDEAGPAVRLAEGACETTIARAREADPEPEPEPTLQEAVPARPEASESDLEEIAGLEPYPEPIHLPWRGAGNVVAAAGCAILALVARA